MQDDNPTSENVSNRPSRALRPWIFSALFATLLAAGCASTGSSPEERVQKRAAERWEALVKADFNRAYGFSTSGFRAVVKPESFPARIQGPVVWLGAEVVNVNCPEPFKCIARVRIDHRTLLARSAGNTSTHVDEIWLLENNQWWIFMTV